jgi:hypothetical protein
VRTNGGGAFVPLNPRQALTAAPYAIHAGTAATASTASNVVNGAVVKSLNNLRDNPQGVGYAPRGVGTRNTPDDAGPARRRARPVPAGPESAGAARAIHRARRP